MTQFDSFNMPQIDFTTLPKVARPAQEVGEAMRLYMETGCIPTRYIESVTAPSHGIVIQPSSTALCFQNKDSSQ